MEPEVNIKEELFNAVKTLQARLTYPVEGGEDDQVLLAAANEEIKDALATLYATIFVLLGAVEFLCEAEEELEVE